MILATGLRLRPTAASGAAPFSRQVLDQVVTGRVSRPGRPAGAAGGRPAGQPGGGEGGQGGGEQRLRHDNLVADRGERADPGQVSPCTASKSIARRLTWGS